MDRLDFTSQIDYRVDNKEKEVTKHFDEIMSLYDIIGTIESSITATIEKEIISFNIETRTEEQRIYILERLNTLTVKKFNHDYFAVPNIVDNCLNVILQER